MDSRPESLVFYLCPETDSTSSISTNATAPNLPGTGRTVGLVYDALGNRLERALRRFVKARNRPASGLISSSESSLRTTSTATQSNNPGTGRVIGLAYSSLGRVLVKRLNSIACKVGLGPEKAGGKIDVWRSRVADKYMNRTGDATNQNDLEDLVVRKDTKKIKKFCKVLIRYAQSDVLSNQCQALALITNLSVEEPYIRQILEELGANAILANIFYKTRYFSDYAATLTMTGARKALISVSEVKISGLGNTIQDIARTTSFTAEKGERLCDLLKELLLRGSDPDVNFLLFCHLRRLPWSLSSFLKSIRGQGRLLDIATLAITSCMERTVGDGSKIEDWTGLDHTIGAILRHWIFPNCTLACEYHQPYLRIILRFPHKLPSSIAFLKSLVENSWNAVSFPVNGQMRIFIPLSIVPFPDNFCDFDNSDLLTFGQSIVNSDHPMIKDLLETMLCPPFLLLRQAILGLYPVSSTRATMRLIDFTPLDPEDILRLPPPQFVESICLKLIDFSSSSQTKIKFYAINCLIGLGRSNHYFSEAILRLSGNLEQSQLTRKIPRVGRFGKPRGIIYRDVSCTSGTLELLTRWDKRAPPYPVLNIQDFRLCIVLEFHPSEFMWLEILPHMAFHIEDHNPIGAGTNIHGEPIFVAGVSTRRDRGIRWRSTILCTVCDGDMSVTYKNTKGEFCTTYNFYVLVLRRESPTQRRVNLRL